MTLRARIQGIATIIKIRIRQRARLANIRLGDANSKLFHLWANGRRRKNFIVTLRTPQGLAITHAEKQEVLRAHYEGCLGTAEPRKTTFNWEELGYHARDLSALEAPFLLDELKKAIFDMPREKAPGPDGFIGLFFRSCWDTISEDLLAAITQLVEMGDGGAPLLNSANIVLIPKKPDAEVVGDFRPISLIHSVSKLLSKMMATRVAPLLSELVSASQSAFIKKRCIHDNFLHVQSILRELHSDKIPSFFVKLDISKAFDSVNWAYLTELLGVLGFGPRWIRWVCLLLSMASSRVLLNGKPGPRIRHARGLRQGDPLSHAIHTRHRPAAPHAYTSNGDGGAAATSEYHRPLQSITLC